MDKRYRARKTAKGILYESNKDIEAILKKLGSKSLRKKIKNMPQPPEVRLVDIEDPLVAMSWSERMEEAEEEGYRREERRRYID